MKVGRPDLLFELEALWRWCLEQKQNSARAVVGINESDIDAVHEEWHVQGQRLNAAGRYAQVLDQQVGSDTAAEYCPSRKRGTEACMEEMPI